MNRENIYAALFALWGNDPVLAPMLVTKSRLLLHWDDVTSAQCPALFQVQGNEDPMYASIDLPPKWKLNPQIYVYVDTSGASDRIPSVVMNPVLDAIFNALENAKSKISNRLTLGEQALQCRIGHIETDEGVLGTKGVAIFTLELTTVE